METDSFDLVENNFISDYSTSKWYSDIVWRVSRKYEIEMFDIL